MTDKQRVDLVKMRLRAWARIVELRSENLQPNRLGTDSEELAQAEAYTAVISTVDPDHPPLPGEAAAILKEFSEARERWMIWESVLCGLADVRLVEGSLAFRISELGKESVRQNPRLKEAWGI